MTPEDETHFDRFSALRASHAHLLKPGERWLTTDDKLELGDVYIGFYPELWPFIKPTEGAYRVGDPVPLGMLCYTPKGYRSPLT